MTTLSTIASYTPDGSLLRLSDGRLSLISRIFLVIEDEPDCAYPSVVISAHTSEEGAKAAVEKRREQCRNSPYRSQDVTWEIEEKELLP